MLCSKCGREMEHQDSEPDVGIETLAQILRDQTKWPEGFQWDYSDCRQCAMGLALRLWQRTFPINYLTETCAMLQMPVFYGKQIFCGYEQELITKSPRDITPLDVADAIDRYLTKIQDEEC
jgi:hypothetical protein